MCALWGLTVSKLPLEYQFLIWKIKSYRVIDIKSRFSLLFCDMINFKLIPFFTHFIVPSNRHKITIQFIFFDTIN
jgi:hypothetical protein